MIIYQIKQLSTGRLYVGQTTKALKQRWQAHVWNSRRKIPTTEIAKAIASTGVEDFHVSMLCTCSSVQDLNIQELRFIQELGSQYPVGFNARMGGNCASFCAETRKKISAKLKGRVFSLETLAKMRKAALRRGPHTDSSTRAKLSLAQRKRKYSTHSPEVKARISEACKRGWALKKHKETLCLSSNQI